jgi:tellurite resistance protein
MPIPLLLIAKATTIVAPTIFELLKSSKESEKPDQKSLDKTDKIIGFTVKVAFADGVLEEAELEKIKETFSILDTEELLDLVKKYKKAPLDLGVLDEYFLTRSEREDVWELGYFVALCDGEFEESENRILTEAAEVLSIPSERQIELRDKVDAILEEASGSKLASEGPKKTKSVLSAAKRFTGQGKKAWDSLDSKTKKAVSDGAVSTFKKVTGRKK